MVKTIAVGGLPASGKTTILRKVREHFEPRKQFKFGLVRGEYHVDGKKEIHFVGVFDNSTYEGTDKLSMAVQTDFTRYIAYLKNQKSYCIVVFEGDRLFNLKAIEESEAMVVLIEADCDIINERHEIRKDEQSEQFKKGRATKIQNIVGKIPHERLINNDQEQLIYNASYLLRKILETKF